jgi:hypothetical protein
MIPRNGTARFALGQVVGTPGALRALAAAGKTPAEFLTRHVSGDWGDVSAETAHLNDGGGDRILSIYALADGQCIWVLTEADRSSTCILLPSEY